MDVERELCTIQTYTLLVSQTMFALSIIAKKIHY